MKELPKHGTYWFLFFFCCILIYELPYLLTLRKTGWTTLPAVVDYPADQMLYLNLSAIRHSSPIEVLNPWYGNPVPALDVPHLRFPITFLLFHLTHAIFRSWTLAMLIWAAVWAGLTFWAASFCLDSMFPHSDKGLMYLGAFALLVLQSPLVYLAAFRNLPTVAGFYHLSLPYVRFAFPQVVLPAVLTYLGLQSRALKSGSRWALAGMALLQFAVFAAFPYALVVVAVGSAISILIAQSRKKELVLSWREIALFAGVSGMLDVVYFWLAGLGSSHGNVRFALEFRPEIFLPSLRPYVLLLVGGAVFALLSRVPLAAKATVAGLALSHALFAFSDVFFPATSIMLNHVNYTVALTTWLPLIVALWPYLEKHNRPTPRIMLASIVFLIALWEAFAGYRASLPINTFHAAAAVELEELALTQSDLVVGPAQFSDDVSCWVPLIAPAKVLFTRDAENILSADSIRTEQAFRQAVYLKMTGVSHDSLLSFTEPGSPDSRINPIALFGELGYASSPLQADHAKVRSLVRERLGPNLMQLEYDPASARRLFQAFSRVIVIDSSSDPRFAPAAWSPWLHIEQAYERNGTRVWICRPKSA